VLEKQSVLWGIIGGIIGGIAVSVVSVQINNWLESPDVQMGEMGYLQLPITDRDFGYSVTVYNQGNKIAKICSVILNGDKKELYGTMKIGSTVFSLYPGEEEKIEIYGLIYENPGNYTIEANVKCINHDPITYLSVGLEVNEPTFKKEVNIIEK